MTALLRANGLALSAARGRVFGPLDIALVSPFALVVGEGGSGRTSLLLTLAGRMKPSAGQLEVLGATGIRAIQRLGAIAGFSGIDDLEDSVTVSDAVTERLRWDAPWYRRVPRADAATVARVLDRAFGDLPQPSADTMIWDLDEDARLLLRIALALVDAPQILFVDNVDHVHNLAAQADVLRQLARLTGEGVAVVASASALTPELFDGLPVAVSVLSTRPEPVADTVEARA